jgi:probable F420-dependent oxidoreductase
MDFTTLMIGEHIISPYNIADESNAMYTWPLYDPYIVTGLISAVTERIKIAYGVLLVPFRNPIILAKMVATMDHLSGGRIIFGAGIGHKIEADALGINSKNLGRRTNEYIEAMQALWSSEQPVFHGNEVHVEGVYFKPRPLQERIPIWFGGRSDAAFRRMFRYGTGFHYTPHSIEALRPRMERMHEVAAEEGKNVADYTVSTRPRILFQDEIIPNDDPRVQNGATLRQGGVIIGPPNYVVEQLARYETELGINLVTPDLHDWYSGMRAEHQHADQIAASLTAMEILATKVVPQLPRSTAPAVGGK